MLKQLKLLYLRWQIVQQKQMQYSSEHVCTFLYFQMSDDTI